MKKLRNILILVLVLVLLGGGGYAYDRYQTDRLEAARIAGYQTEALMKDTLVVQVGSTGTVRANETAALIWETSGQVEAIFTELSQEVSAGEVLGILSPASLSPLLLLAQADLAVARQSLDTLQEPAGSVALAQAARRILELEHSQADAQYALNRLNTPPTQNELDIAYANVIAAQDHWESIVADNERLRNKLRQVGRLTHTIEAGLEAQEAMAEESYYDALSAYEDLLDGPDPADVTAAEADLALAHAQLEDARQIYQDLLVGAAPEDITAAEARIAASQAALQTASVTAPFAGTITQVLGMVGDLVQPGTLAFRVDDLSRLLVDVELAEVDVNQVKIGQSAVLYFDGVLGEEYHGRVIQVALIGTPTLGMVSYKVTVELQDADERVRPGMTAAVYITVEELVDALLVPNRAVRVLAGERVLYVLRDNDTLESIIITLGLSGDLYSQVLGDAVQAGDLVVLNP